MQNRWDRQADPSTVTYTADKCTSTKHRSPSPPPPLYYNSRPEAAYGVDPSQPALLRAPTPFLNLG